MQGSRGQATVSPDDPEVPVVPAGSEAGPVGVATPGRSADPAGGSDLGPDPVGPLIPADVDEAGTPPEDRRFRPDIEGLRAVAVLLVVLEHAKVPFFSAGYIGVDVFFVISGFVITGLLLRQASASGTPSLSWFYGRRVRRIIPAAMFVIVVTVALERLLIGSAFAADVAHDGRWASVFLANFTPAHGGNVFKPSPAPFGNYWSLAVEEQFYLIYPLCFVAVVSIASRRSARAKVGVFLGVVAAGSFAMSVVSSRGLGTFFAYVDPVTRAWELAVGGLVAVGAVSLKRLPEPVLAAVSWAGLGLILYGSHVITGSHGGYPGYIAAVPVLATALLIVAGTSVPRGEWSPSSGWPRSSTSAAGPTPSTCGTTRSWSWPPNAGDHSI